MAVFSIVAHLLITQKIRIINHLNKAVVLT